MTLPDIEYPDTPIARRDYHQTRFEGKTADPDQQGDCWATAVACFAGKPPEWRDTLHAAVQAAGVLHDHDDPDTDPEWWNVTQRHLNDAGLPILAFGGPSPYTGAHFPNGPILIVSGPSPRIDGWHSVLWDTATDTLWHDPHPDGTGLLSIEELVGWRDESGQLRGPLA